MKDFDTLVEALQDLQKRGYTEDFNLLPDCIECKNQRISPSDFTIVEVYRFEGMSSTGDSSVLYAIEATNGDKGTLVDAYGTYASAMTDEMIEKFRYRGPR